MDFGNESSLNGMKFDFELFRNEVDCIHEGIIDDPHKILIQIEYLMKNLAKYHREYNSQPGKNRQDHRYLQMLISCWFFLKKIFYGDLIKEITT